MATIRDLETLGFTVGIASGCTETEETALHNAKVEASPQAVTREAGRITAMTLGDLQNAGRLPANADEKQALAARIAARALEMVTEVATEKVAFHERAVAEAKAMPTVWHVDQTVGIDGNGNQRVVSIYVACAEDGTGWDEESQAALDALSHQPSYDERVFQAQNPDAMQAASQLESSGSTVSREAGESVFLVDGSKVQAVDLPALAESVQAEALAAEAVPPEAPAK